jgi:hypothetical protein
MGNVSDPDFRVVLEAKELKKREEDDAGDPPNDAADEERAEPRRHGGACADPGYGKAEKKRRLLAVSKERRQRPALVWAISLIVGLIAITDLSVQSLSFVPGLSVSILSVLANAVESTPVLDRTILFLSSAMLLTSMILFFRMSKTSFLWFVAYLGLGSAAVVREALTSAREPWFNGPASLMGIAITAAILAYMWQLKRRQFLM